MGVPNQVVYGGGGAGVDVQLTKDLGYTAKPNTGSSGSNKSGIGAAGIASTIIGTLANAWVSYSAGKREADAYAFQERIAAINEKRAKMQAQATLHNSNRNIANITGQYAQMKSKQRVGFAANGVALNFGSSKEVLATTDLYKQMDVNTAYSNGINAALGYMANATSQYQAQIAAKYSQPSQGTIAVSGLLDAFNKTYGYYLDNTYSGFSKSQKRATDEVTE